MGDVSAEPSMEDILSSIKRIIAEDIESGTAPRPRRRPAAPAPRAVDVTEEDVLELNQPVAEAEAPMSEAVEPVATPEPIMSDQVAEASRARLDSLSRMVVKPDVAGNDTLEGMVREMLKPMLREWLDANLPDLVERLVAKEISRISGQG